MYAFSQRLSEHTSVNQITRAIDKRKHENVPMSDLSESNPTKALSSYPHTAIAKSLGKIQNFTYRPEARGILEARQSIARFYAERGIAVDPDDLFLTASTSEAYTHLFKLLCNPGEIILSPSPSYPLFEHLADLSSVMMKPYRLLYDGSWHIDLEHLRSQICSRTKAIVVVNPNNPTGSFLARSELLMLREISEASRLPLIADEVFQDYPLSEELQPQSCLTSDESLPSFVMNGLSKTAGMPQMKLAWTIVRGPSAFRSAAFERIELMTDTYLSVSAPVQSALSDLLTIGDGIRQEIKQQCKTNLRRLQQTFEGTAVTVLHLEGGWSAILRLPSILDEETWVLKLIREQNTIVQPGFFFDVVGGPHIVVSLLTYPEVFAKGTKAILRLLKEQTG